MFSPRNWTFLCKLNFVTSIILIIDWILGVVINPSTLARQSYLATIVPKNFFFFFVFPLLSLILIFFLSPLLSEKLDKSPFITAILILVIVYLGVNEYTLLGRIAATLLTLGCSIIIVLISINITILENEEPISNVKAMLIGVILMAINFTVNFLIFGWRIDETWAFIYIIVAIVGIALIQTKKILIGAAPIFVCAVLNDYIFPFGLDGFDAGAELLKFLSLFFIIYHFTRK